jgi:hypothetical protein
LSIWLLLVGVEVAVMLVAEVALVDLGRELDLQSLLVQLTQSLLEVGVLAEPQVRHPEFLGSKELVAQIPSLAPLLLPVAVVAEVLTQAQANLGLLVVRVAEALVMSLLLL